MSAHFFMSDEQYGIDIEHAHKRAIDLIPEEFFWDCMNDFSPFGSDEGDMALAEYRDWRKSNPASPLLECLKWVIESVGDMDFKKYNSKLLDPKKIRKQIENEDFDDQQYIFTLDVSVIATGFGQLVDEGKIEPNCKAIIELAIDRQAIWAMSIKDSIYSNDYISNLNVLKRALHEA